MARKKRTPVGSWRFLEPCAESDLGWLMSGMEPFLRRRSRAAAYQLEGLAGSIGWNKLIGSF